MAERMIVPGASPWRAASPAYHRDLPQIVRDGCAPSQGLPSRTFNHFNYFRNFAVSSFFDQCTGGKLLVN